jgi:heme oxygenase (biliverdin-IX-beta and delta-forming)
MNTVVTSLEEEIKKRTKQAHIETEHLLVPKLKSIRSKEDYAALLAMFYGFFGPLQERIERYINKQVLPDIEQRRKAVVIEQDIFNLQVNKKLDICDDLPTIHRLLQAFGALYVIEGSTLGGEIISKMLRKNEAVNIPEDSLQFFKGYGDQNGAMWQRFKQHMFLHLHNDEDVTTTTDAANETFVKLKNWMLKFY